MLIKFLRILSEESVSCEQRILDSSCGYVGLGSSTNFGPRELGKLS